jgi:hypothetical protein
LQHRTSTALVACAGTLACIQALSVLDRVSELFPYLWAATTPARMYEFCPNRLVSLKKNAVAALAHLNEDASRYSPPARNVNRLLVMRNGFIVGFSQQECTDRFNVGMSGRSVGL